MAEDTWTEQIINGFFAARRSPTRARCDQLARSVSNTTAVRPVDVPGSLSYTVICSQDAGAELKPGNAVVVSFRQLESELSERLVDLARTIYGDLVPETHYHGTVDGSDPPLAIYSMALLPGIACIEALGCEADLDLEEEAKHIRFMESLARYFAQCWSVPQRTGTKMRVEAQEEISQRLTALLASPSNVVSASTVSELQSALPLLYASDYPQVLTHGDFSKTNVLVNPETYEVTGVVDWSLASVQSFGFDLDCLFLMTGYMDLNGWHNYTCRSRLLEAFWSEFGTVSGITVDGKVSREDIRTRAEVAAKIGALLRYAFDRNADGSPSAVLSTSGPMQTMLKAWF